MSATRDGSPFPKALVEAFPDATLVVNEKKPRHKAFEVTLVQDGKAEPGTLRHRPGLPCE